MTSFFGYTTLILMFILVYMKGYKEGKNNVQR